MSPIIDYELVSVVFDLIAIQYKCVDRKRLKCLFFSVIFVSLYVSWISTN